MGLLFSITMKDCVVGNFTVGGHGGAGKDTSNTGVRITHPPSGAVGRATETRSQVKNKRTAFVRMANTKEFKVWHKAEVNRLLKQTQAVKKYTTGNKGFGSKYLRTYDFPDQQVKDHETKMIRKDVAAVMDGDIDSFIRARKEKELCC